MRCTAAPGRRTSLPMWPWGRDSWPCGAPSAFSSAGDINRERYSGTLALLFAAPAGFPAIVLGKILGNTFLSLASIGISVATAALLFGVPVAVASPGYFLLALICALGAFAAFSLVIACLLTLSRRTELYMNCIENSPDSPLRLCLPGFGAACLAPAGELRPLAHLGGGAIAHGRVGRWRIRRPLAGSWQCSWLSRRFRRSLPLALFRAIDRQVRISRHVGGAVNGQTIFLPGLASFIKVALPPSLWWNFCASIPSTLW